MRRRNPSQLIREPQTTSTIRVGERRASVIPLLPRSRMILGRDHRELAKMIVEMIVEMVVEMIVETIAAIIAETIVTTKRPILEMALMSTTWVVWSLATPESRVHLKLATWVAEMDRDRLIRMIADVEVILKIMVARAMSTAIPTSVEVHPTRLVRAIATCQTSERIVIPTSPSISKESEVEETVVVVDTVEVINHVLVTIQLLVIPSVPKSYSRVVAEAILEVAMMASMRSREKLGNVDTLKSMEGVMPMVDIVTCE